MIEQIDQTILLNLIVNRERVVALIRQVGNLEEQLEESEEVPAQL